MDKEIKDLIAKYLLKYPFPLKRLAEEMGIGYSTLIQARDGGKLGRISVSKIMAYLKSHDKDNENADLLH